MTRSVNAAIDKVSPQRSEVAALIAEYGESDLLCYRAESPVALSTRQAAAWDPILHWAASALGASLSVGAGVMHITQPANSVETLRAHVAKQNAFQLTALHDLVSLSGSLIIGLAAQRNAFDIHHLWTLSRIDEDWQIEQWGHDEEADTAAEIKRAAFIHAHQFFHAQD